MSAALPAALIELLGARFHGAASLAQDVGRKSAAPSAEWHTADNAATRLIRPTALFGRPALEEGTE